MLDVDFDADMVEPYESEEAVASFRSAHTVSITDPKLLRRKRIDALQADKWRTVKLPRPLLEETMKLARDYGYQFHVEP